jgi:hypothetical protein
VNAISDINTMILLIYLFKGAAATALYGPETSSGVMDITFLLKNGESIHTSNAVIYANHILCSLKLVVWWVYQFWLLKHPWNLYGRFRRFECGTG